MRANDVVWSFRIARAIGFPVAERQGDLGCDDAAPRLVVEIGASDFTWGDFT